MVKEFFSRIEQVTNIGKSRREMQRKLNVNEAWNLWEVLSTKYDVIEDTDKILSFAKDNDLKIFINSVHKEFKKQANDMEDILLDYGLELPARPPEGNVLKYGQEIFTDRYMYERLFDIYESILPMLVSAYMGSTTAKIRKFFKDTLAHDMERYDTLLEYGKIKGYYKAPPAYRP